MSKQEQQSHVSTIEAQQLQEGQPINEAVAHRIVATYSNELMDFTLAAERAERFAALPEQIEALNDYIEKTDNALFAFIAVNNTSYRRDQDANSWSLDTAFTKTGRDRPFVGNKILIAEFDGHKRLLLADTNRGEAIDGFYGLSIRPESDKIVRDYSSDEAVATIQKLGQVAQEQHITPTLNVGRWGDENIN